MSNWFYAQDSQHQGPFNEAELKEMLAVGKLPRAVLVWKEGMENWAAADTVPEFQFRPPPIPSRQTTPPPARLASDPAPQEKLAPAAESDPDANSETGPAYDADPDDVARNKTVAMVAYFWVLFLVPLVVAPNSAFAKYHANQGLILFIASLILMVADSVLRLLPLIGFGVNIAIWAILVAYVILGIVNAARGKARPLPIIGHYKLLL